MDADVLDVFAAPATPRWRVERPAQVRARLAWAGQRLAAARVAPLTQVLGVAVDDKVLVEVRPGLVRPGVVVAWERTLTGALALVHLIIPAPGVASLRAPRHRLTPIPERP